MKSNKNSIEQYFEWWLDQMVFAGYVKSYAREPESRLVSEPATYGRYKRFKSKEKEIEEFNLFPKITYTDDYHIIWDKSAEYIFYEEVLDTPIFLFGKPDFVAHDIDGEIMSYVDVKPTNSVMQRGGKVSSAYSFPYKRRMIWENERIYINKVVPIPMAGTGFKSALFVTTFCPDRFLLTDGGGMRRKIKFPTTLLADYVKKKTTYINNLLKNTK